MVLTSKQREELEATLAKSEGFVVLSVDSLTRYKEAEIHDEIRVNVNTHVSTYSSTKSTVYHLYSLFCGVEKVSNTLHTRIHAEQRLRGPIQKERGFPCVVELGESLRKDGEEVEGPMECSCPKCLPEEPLRLRAYLSEPVVQVGTKQEGQRFDVGDRVVPHSKNAGVIKDFRDSGPWKRSQNRDQPFLYVVGTDSEEAKNGFCYILSEDPEETDGDLYLDSDLMSYRNWKALNFSARYGRQSTGGSSIETPDIGKL